MFIAEDLTLKPIYNAIITNFYNTSLEKANFAAPKDTAEIINNFVKEKTNGAFDHVFDEDAINPLSK